MAGDTNVHSDEQEFIKLVVGALRFGEELALKDTSKEKQLRDALLKDLFPNGVDGKMAMRVDYHIVPKEFIADIKKQLNDQNIPYLCTLSSPDKGGDYLILVGENHAKDFEQIQADSFSKSTKFARQSTAIEMLNRCERRNEDHIVGIEFQNEAAANKFQQMLYDNEIVCAELKLDDGITKFYIDTNALTRGEKDLVTAEMTYALDQAVRDFLPEESHLADLQAEYDDKMVMDFAKAVKEGKSCVLGDANNLRNASYLSSKNGDVTLHYMENGNKMELPINIEKGASINQIQAVISKQARGIHDKVLYANVKDWQNGSLPQIAVNVKNMDLRPTSSSLNKKTLDGLRDQALNKFVSLARKGQEVVLGNVDLPFKTHLSAKDGNIYINAVNEKGRKTAIQVDLTDCNNQARIIDAVKAATQGQLDAFSIVRGIDVWEKGDTVEIGQNLELDLREQANKANVEVLFTKDMKDDMVKIFEAISLEAEKSMHAQIETQGRDSASLTERYELKKECVMDILKGDKLPVILQNYDIDPSFLEKRIAPDDTSREFSSFSMKDMLDNMAKHFSDPAEQSKDECIVEVEKITKNVKKRIVEEQNRSDGKFDVQKTEEQNLEQTVERSNA